MINLNNYIYDREDQYRYRSDKSIKIFSVTSVTHKLEIYQLQHGDS